MLADRTISTDATQFILDGDTATVTATPTGLSVTSGGPLAAGPTAIAPALAALGANAPTSFDDLKAKHLAERAKPLPDQTYLGQLNALAAPWGLADTRKSSVNTAWGNASTPSSVIGGATAKRALEVFFGGLPGGPLYTARTVAANEVTEGTAPTVSVTVSNPAGRTPAGNLSVDVKSAGASVHTGTAAVTGGAASFTLPATLAPGTYEYTVSYAGDEFIDAWSETRSLTVKAKDVVVDPTPEPTPDPTVVPIVTPAPTATPTPIPVAVKAKASKVARCRLQGADEQEVRQVQGHDHHGERQGQGHRQGHAHAQEGQDDQEGHGHAEERRGDRQGAEARQGHLEGDRRLGRRHDLPGRVGVRGLDQGHEVGR